jgi:hypothetical protein
MPDFKIIDANEIAFVKRGRKARVNDELVAAIAKLPVGKAIALTSLKIDPKASTYFNDKARVASGIRTACRAAGLETYRIAWSPVGVPQIVR